MATYEPVRACPDCARWAAVVELGADIVVVTDKNGVVRYANAAIERELGYDPAAIVGRSVFDVLHPGEVADAMNSFASTVDRGERHAVTLPLRVRTAGGGWRRFEVVATNLFDEPSVAGIAFQCRAVSEREDAHRRFREVFEQSPVAQALMRPGEVGVIANNAFAQLFGTTREVLLSMRGRDLVHPDEITRLEHDYTTLLQDGGNDRLVGTRRYVCANGDSFHGRVATSVLRDLDGAPEYLFTTIEDLSDEIAAADALARSEARARTLVEHSPAIIAILYADGEWEANDQGTRLLGYPKGFDPQGGVFSLVHGDDVASAAEALAEVVDGTRAADDAIELRLRAIDGTYRVFECVGQNFTDDPHIGGIVITARDITARKHAEARLRAAEQRFAVAFTHGPAPMSIIDLDGHILDINPAACALLGRPRDELIGTLAELSVHPDDRRYAMDRTTAQLADPTVTVEFRFITATGRAIPVLSHAALVEPATPDGPPYLITLQTDISERKDLEAELVSRASRDALTGLYNRAALHDHLARELTRRGSGVLAAMFFDLDNFKTINDTYGHEAGDQLLIHVAHQLHAHVRAADITARIGGDEFIVICETTDAADAFDIGERIRTAIATDYRYDDQPINITASLGIALAQPHDTVTTLLRRADTAAYLAKHAGKARTELINT